MKSSPFPKIGILTLIFLISCQGQATTAAVDVLATASNTSEPTPTILQNTATPSPTPLPDFELAEIPGLLQSALTLESVSEFNGHGIARATGWKYGFDRVEWMDQSHLLLYPYAGVIGVADTYQAGAYPAVVNLDTGTFWIPKPGAERNFSGSILPRWSARLDILIDSGPDDTIVIHDPDGGVQQIYQGPLLGVSPSATKLLVDSDTWIDLSNGKTVDFDWYQAGPAADLANYAIINPIWSPDEMQVYTCCYLYGDASSGTSYGIPYNEIPMDGKTGEGFALDAWDGVWVLNGRYLLPIWGGIFDGRPDFVSLFDPAARTYRNLSAVMGVPYLGDGEPYCGRPSAKNGARYVWVVCQDGGYLIDLANFHSQMYPQLGAYAAGGIYAEPSSEGWSADGNYLLISQENGQQIVSVTNEEARPLPEDCYGIWHPVDPTLMCLPNAGNTLLLLDVEPLSVRAEISLPTQFQDATWSTGGNHIALLAVDSSIWQIEYPALENLEQLTDAMPEWTGSRYPNGTESKLTNVVWSPDDTALAFISPIGVYIVNAVSGP